MGKKTVKITREDGVTQGYHVGSDAEPPEAAPEVPEIPEDHDGDTHKEPSVVEQYKKFVSQKGFRHEISATQDELDDALKLAAAPDGPRRISIDSGEKDPSVSEADLPTIVLRDVPEGVEVHVSGGGGSRLEVRGGATVHAHDEAHVTADDTATVFADGDSFTRAKGKSRVFAMGDATVYAQETSKVEAHDKARVVAMGESTVLAAGHAQVEIEDSSHVIAGEYASVLIRYRDRAYPDDKFKIDLHDSAVVEYEEI